MPDEATPETAPDDEQAMLDHCASECMKAIEIGDKTMFRDALHVLIADIMKQMQEMPDVDGT